MEVHHHAHPAPDGTHSAAAGHRKKWTHYVWEFLMLFLAVFCGFLAENLREHTVEKHREKEYLRSMLDDLKYDTAKCGASIGRIIFLTPLFDSAYENVKHADHYQYTLSGKWNLPINATGIDYKPMMPTIQQLKSSGNLRLIRNREILNKVLEYETFIRGNFELTYNEVQKAKIKIFDLEDELCDYDQFNKYYVENIEFRNDIIHLKTAGYYDMPILTRDGGRLNLLANSFVNCKVWNLSSRESFGTAKQKATELIAMINAEYHLK